MGAVILNGAHISSGAIIGAGALILANAQVPSGAVMLGVPGHQARQVTTDEQQMIAETSDAYVAKAARHMRLVRDATLIGE
jgi:carbonic anhydrase/acetyltransferase-like protein (isoleucine patch superfamily)